CEKSGVNPNPLASLNLVNFTVGLGAVKVNFTNAGGKNGQYQYYNQITTSVAYGNNSVFAVLANQSVPLNIVLNADSTKLIYNSTLDLSNGSISSLYLAGKLGAVDTILIQDFIPYHGDSSCGVRFINLSPNSNP